MNQIQNKNPEFVLSLGDLSYGKTGDCWLKIIGPIESKMKTAMGDHEHGDEGPPASLLAQYKNHFNLSKTYYSFNYQNVHFIVMDSNVTYSTNSPQYLFVRNDLIGASQNPDIKWIIVYFHIPIYTSLSKHPPDKSLRSIYHPLFDQYDVDFVLQGHNHNYQRSYPISYNSVNQDNPSKTSTNSSTYNDPKGEVYVVAGTAGRSLYDLESKAPFMVKQYKGYGFLNIDITNDDAKTTKLTGTFYANKDGSIKDTFTIVK